jgi:hypothetical protein
MAANIIIVGEDGKPKEEKKPDPKRPHRRRGSGKNKKKLQEEAVKKYKEDQSKKTKAIAKNYFMLGALGLPAGMVFFYGLKMLVEVMSSIVANWAQHMMH